MWCWLWIGWQGPKKQKAMGEMTAARCLVMSPLKVTTQARNTYSEANTEGDWRRRIEVKLLTAFSRTLQLQMGSEKDTAIKEEGKDDVILA